MTKAELDLLGGREPRIGIALSGGGVRSAFYVAGALEALYEKRILQRSDVISTVSGGGYTAYWVYTSQATAEAEAQRQLAFGAPLFGETIFPENLCHLVTHANFVTLPRMAGAAITGSSVRLYDRRIREVFGINDSASGMTMAEMGALVRTGHPYLIVNATVDRARATDWADGLYEFNGVGTRGRGRGEVLWEASDRATPYRLAVGISGAAFAPFLKQTIAEPPGATDGATVTLNDGGASENLGAIALIRRAVPTIVIIDAEHDPRYRFGAYVNLKNRLPRWGANIVIPGIEAFLASGRHDSPDTSYFRGTVTGRRAEDGSLFTLQIHYLKMSYGPTLRERLNDAWRGNDTGPPGWQDFNAARTSAAGCSALSGRNLDLPNLFGYAVQHYGEWWNRRLRSRLLGGFLSLNFPQYSTGDQSMYVDQAPAFIGLGYLQASEIPAQDVLDGVPPEAGD